MSSSAPRPAGHWLMATPHTLWRTGPGTVVPVGTGPGQSVEAAAVAEHLLAAAPPDHAVVGTLAFDETQPPALTLAPLTAHPRPDAAPTARRHATSDPEALATPFHPPVPYGPPTVGERPAGPTPEDRSYLHAVTRALHQLETGTIDKIVLSRSRHLTGPLLPNAATLWRRLVQAHPTAYVFAGRLPSDEGQSARTLVGASPELLLQRTGDRLRLNPLAGTTPRGPTPAADAAAARALLNSGKDRHEHALLITDLTRRLKPWCAHLDVPPTPSLTAAGGLWHLSTTITATLRRPVPSALRLAAVLHPTPAVCGIPRATARDLIHRLESRSRNYFSGITGWMDRYGDGQWVIALRCGELSPAALTLWAGAGIVAGSTPHGELAETTAKMNTVLHAALPQPCGSDGRHSGRPRSPGASGAVIV
ncbi:isochorismate synthase MenF [Streptomyces sp. NPDC101150]|uniref:isochorismate synthase n=1 Tax=Streptomyces sp. NPDC101150 TaxID=3366114 RepID=UPI0038021F35